MATKSQALAASDNRKYTDEQKREAVALQAIYGNTKKVAQMTGINRKTIQYWKSQDWWPIIMAEVKPEVDAYIRDKTQHTISACFEGIADRVQNGDYKVGKDGELIRVPMTGRDLTWTAAVMVDKRQLIMSQPTSITGSTDSSAMLEGVAEYMRQIADDVAEQREKQVVSDQ